MANDVPKNRPLLKDFSREKLEEMRQLYEYSVRTERDIAKMFGISQSTLNMWSKKFGWKRRANEEIHGRASVFYQAAMAAGKETIEYGAHMSDEEIIEANSRKIAEVKLSTQAITDKLKRAADSLTVDFGSLQEDYPTRVRCFKELTQAVSALTDVLWKVHGIDAHEKTQYAASGASSISVEFVSPEQGGDGD